MDEKDELGDFEREVIKKDSDAQVVKENGMVYLLTELDIDGLTEVTQEEYGDDLLERGMLREEATEQPTDVPVRILFTVFSVNAIFCFAQLMIGFLPYWILRFDESRIASLVLSSMTFTAMVLFYGLMAWQRRTAVGSYFGAIWATSLIFLVASIAAMARNAVPIYMFVIFLAQHCALIGYVSYFTKLDVTPIMYARRTLYASLSSGILVWILGIYLFIEEGAWITASVVLVLVVCNALYAWWKTGRIIETSRYSLSFDDRAWASIEYYTDPLTMLHDRIKRAI